MASDRRKKEIGARVQKARKKLGLTQDQLAELSGSSREFISRLENGTRNPSIKLLQRLAEGMGMVLNVTFVPKDIAAGVKRI